MIVGKQVRYTVWHPLNSLGQLYVTAHSRWIIRMGVRIPWGPILDEIQEVR